MISEDSEKQNEGNTRQERRAEKLRKKRERIPQHGKGMGTIYRNSVLKKLKEK